MMDVNVKKQIRAVIDAHNHLLDQLQAGGAENIAAAAHAIVKSLQQNGTLYICGNGGSAADAQHIAAELVGTFERQRPGLPAIALTTDTSAITSISNDYGYERVFARQVEALIRQGDIFWAISTSGASPNVVAAARLARNKGACVLAFTGKQNTDLEYMADICFCADSESTARSQEIHQVAYHIICDLVEQCFCERPDQK
jgi:D-sedoheptulose 7-phosphate isomerase